MNRVPTVAAFVERLSAINDRVKTLTSSGYCNLIQLATKIFINGFNEQLKLTCTCGAVVRDIQWLECLLAKN